MGRLHSRWEKVTAVSSSNDRKGRPSSAGGRRATPKRGADTSRGAGKKGASASGRRGTTAGKSRAGAAKRRREPSAGEGGKRDGGKRTRAREDSDPGKAKRLPAAAAGLPRHVVESLMRVTPAKRQAAALSALAAAAEAFSEGQYHSAVRKAENAKELASRDATIREILGLAAYRIGDWSTALRELRTYRRLSGETTHMPVEMDVLRALGRSAEVVEVWEEFRRRGGSPAATKEARVVYASHLIDEGALEEADAVGGRVRLIDDPWPEDLRLWYTAARIAALRGDPSRARMLADRIVVEDPSFPGLDELDRLIDGT